MSSSDQQSSEEKIKLPTNAPMKAYQDYINQLENLHGWQDVDLVHNCFLMGEEVGELFKGVRKYLNYASENHQSSQDMSQELSQDMSQDMSQETSKLQIKAKQNIAEEIVDVFNYLLAIANRLDIDVEEAFRDKNKTNQNRTWKS
jgi:NTP pyrophosphatase (non-canonical NTP hydrolase)